MTLIVVDHFEHSDTGRQRKANEDSLFARSPLFAVADGMGGAQAGEVASRIAVEAFEPGLPDIGSAEERLATIARTANDRIHALASRDDQRAGMGTTLTAAYVDDDGVAIAHVGDSRAYRWRDSGLERLTRDHSLVGMWIERGDLTEEEAEEHPQRSVITRALGPEPTVEVDTLTEPARPGDLFLLCSDGLTSMVADIRIAELLQGGGSLREVAHRLVDEANERGGRDNISVVLFRVDEAASLVASGVEQPTEVGRGSLTTAAVQAAVRAAEPSRTAPPPPLAPPAPAEPRVRRRRARRIGITLGICLLLGVVITAAFVASRAVYFISTTNDHFVALDRGLPYDGPFGLRLYQTVFRTGVAVDEIAPHRRRALLDHRLRSHDDAFDLTRQIDSGKLGQ